MEDAVTAPAPCLSHPSSCSLVATAAILPPCPSLPRTGHRSSFRPRCSTEGTDSVPPQPGPGQHPLCGAPLCSPASGAGGDDNKGQPAGEFESHAGTAYFSCSTCSPYLGEGRDVKAVAGEVPGRSGLGTSSWHATGPAATCSTGLPWVPSALAPVSLGAAASPQGPTVQGCVPLPRASSGVRSTRGACTSVNTVGVCALGSLQQVGEPQHGRG